ncbi:MAG: hypothetical protein A2V98_17655 [Planctomycetes bacterium RBG_16_64_12]|nr:MAG: hypothetical protein A2V98_17655 [Planctomycetes bacterium RBG_16_64_12]
MKPEELIAWLIATMKAEMTEEHAGRVLDRAMSYARDPREAPTEIQACFGMLMSGAGLSAGDNGAVPVAGRRGRRA